MKKINQSLRDLWNVNNIMHICVMGVLYGKKERNIIDCALITITVAKNLPSLVKEKLYIFQS